MLAFFDRIPPGGAPEFTLFSLTYYVALLASLMLLYLFYLALPWIRKSDHEPIVRYVIAAFLIFTTIYKWTYFIEYDMPWYMFLPEATCGWSIYLGIYTIFTKNRTTFVLTFFWGWGAFTALFAPNILEGPNRWFFYQYFIRHALIVGVALYMMKVHDFKINKKDWRIYFYVTTAMALIGGAFSWIIDDVENLNMFYMLQPAVNNPFLDLIHDFNGVVYAVVWIGIAALLGYIYGIPFYADNKGKDTDN